MGARNPFSGNSSRGFGGGAPPPAGEPAAVRRKKRGSNLPHGELRLIPIVLAKEIKAGDSLAAELLEALKRRGIRFEPGDVLVVKHKIVSKGEGAIVKLRTIKPSPESIAWAKKYNLDVRGIEL